MIYLLLSIACSTLILIIFKLFSRFGQNTRQAIVVNYAVAAAAGWGLHFSQNTVPLTSSWMLPAAGLGLFFYLIFRAMAKVSQENGVTLASLANKTSVVIPVILALLFLGDSLSWIKTTGIIIGLIGIALAMSKGKLDTGHWFWPLVVFVGSGCIDASLKFLQNFLVPNEQFSAFSAFIFTCAFAIGMGHHLWLKRQLYMPSRDLVGGLILGVINFGSILFILQALAIPNLESSVIFPINNVGVVVASAFVGTLLFAERLSFKNWLGVGLAISAIIVLSFSR